MTAEIIPFKEQDAYRMIERCARQAGIRMKIGNHSLRAIGITDYLESTAR
jgi:hypothetical protein